MVVKRLIYLVFAMVALADCSESKTMEEETIMVSLTVTDIDKNQATIGASLRHGNFYGAKIVEAIPYDDVSVNPGDRESLVGYIEANGIDVELPYTKIVTNLKHGERMFSAVMAYNSNHEAADSYYLVWTAQGDLQLKVLSFNVRYASAYSDTGDRVWENRRDACCACILAQNPTVFGVQEAEAYGQMPYLTEGTGYSSYGVGRDDGNISGETTGIFYNEDKVTLMDCGTFWLSETPNTPSYGWDATSRRTATWAIFTHNDTGKKFFYMNTHLDVDGGTARKESILLIVDKFMELNPEWYPIVLTADFNSSASSSIFDPLKEYLADARQNAPTTDTGGTYNGWGGSNSVIDHIFYSEEGFSPVVFGVDRDPYLGITYISDHYPIYCVFDIK